MSHPNQTSRPAPKAVPSNVAKGRPDVNFSTIQELDSGGGWHVLRLRFDGAITADIAALKVLRQFFAEDQGQGAKLPAPLARAFFESRDWGTSQRLSRSGRKYSVTKLGVRLAAQFIPDADGGQIILKVGPAIATVPAAERPLTEREREISALVAMGKTNGEIGSSLSVSARTVQKHLENIFRKLGVETRTGLALRAVALEFDRSA